MPKFYTGIGSTETPKEALDLMFQIAIKLAKQGVVLRSGGGGGGDMAFELGCNSAKGMKELYWPYQANEQSIEIVLPYINSRAITNKYDKSVIGCTPLKLLGMSLDSPSTCLLCYNNNIAMRVAKEYSIPVYNLSDKEVFNKWVKWVNT